MTPEHDRHTAIPDGMSPIYLPIGAVSDNEVAVLGSMGHLFVRGGSNAAIAQYARWQQPEQQPELQRIVDGWVSLIRDRHARVASRGIKFLQTLIPEKSSLYPHLLPPEYAHIDGPTIALDRINKDLSAHPDWYVDAFSVLNDDQSQYAMWPRTGSHWTPAGARALTVELIERIDTRAAYEIRNIPLNSAADIESDLGRHLLGQLIAETAPAPTPDAMSFGKAITHVDGRNDETGKWSSWRCDDPLIDQRVIIFGNSYMQVVPLMDRLSWWFVRTFRESKFVWTPDMQDDVLDEYKPDVVVAQGIERFLPAVPGQ